MEVTARGRNQQRLQRYLHDEHGHHRRDVWKATGFRYKAGLTAALPSILSTV